MASGCILGRSQAFTGCRCSVGHVLASGVQWPAVIIILNRGTTVVSDHMRSCAARRVMLCDLLPRSSMATPTSALRPQNVCATIDKRLSMVLRCMHAVLTWLTDPWLTPKLESARQ